MRLFWFITLVVFPFNFLAGQGSVTGLIKDQTDDAPMEYATIALYDKNDSSIVEGGISDQWGHFELKKIKSGNYYLGAHFIGYEEKIIPGIIISGNETIDLGIITLESHQELLDEIEITGERAVASYRIDKQVYDASEFQSAQGGTATDILRNMPSITVDAQGELSVRGLTGFIVLLNGKPVQSSPSVILNQLPANSIKSVEVITSPSAQYDPDGEAGIINIITRQDLANGFYLQMNGKYGLPSIEDYDNAEKHPRYGADISMSYLKNKWDISAGLSYLRNDIGGRRVGDVYTIINDTLTRFPSDGERSFDEFTYSGRFSLGYRINDRNQVSFGIYAGKHSKDRTADILYYDNHKIYLPTGERLYTLQYFNENLRIRRGDFLLGSIDYNHIFDDNSSLSGSFLYEYTMLGGPTTNINLSWPELTDTLQHQYNTNDNPLHGVRFQIDYSKPMGDGLLEAGYNYRDLDHTGDFIYEERVIGTDEWFLIPEFSSTVNLRRKIHSGYAQYSSRISDFSYNIGVRTEWMDRVLELQNQFSDTTYNYDFIQLYPNIQLQYVFSDVYKIKSSYSRRVERTTTFKMNPFPEREHSETLEQGDPELLPEFIDLAEIGIIRDKELISSFATLYYQHITNLINRVNTVYNDSILNRIYSNVGNASAMGIEFGTEFDPFPWWKIYFGENFRYYTIDGSFDDRPVKNSSWIFSINANTTFDITPTLSLQWSLNYISDRITAQGEDSRFLSPNLTLRKSFLNDNLTATLQWLNMDMGLLPTNEQRITTWQEDEFYTTTNYIYEVDVIMINLSYSINPANKKTRFIKSEFGEKEF